MRKKLGNPGKVFSELVDYWRVLATCLIVAHGNKAFYWAWMGRCCDRKGIDIEGTRSMFTTILFSFSRRSDESLLIKLQSSHPSGIQKG